MLNRSTSLAMSTGVLKALPGKLDIKSHSLSILYISAVLLLSIRCSFTSVRGRDQLSKRYCPMHWIGLRDQYSKIFVSFVNFLCLNYPGHKL